MVEVGVHMEKRISLFVAEEIDDLEDIANHFLETSDGKLHEVQFSMALTPEYDDFVNRPPYSKYAICLIYTPEEEEEDR